MSKKLISLLLALTLLALTACATGTASSGKNTVSTQPTGENENQYAQVSTAAAKEIKIGYYGQAAEYMDLYPEDFGLGNTDYNIERINYGTDEAGQKRLILDVNRGELDLVVCDGQIETGTGFADLYDFIDTDSELTREDFPDWLLDGLEERGHLNQLWGCYVVNTLKAKNALAQEPSPLTLKNCKAYIEANDIDSELFDSYIIKEQLLDYIAPPIMREAFDLEQGSFNFKSEHIKALIALCNTQPESFDWELAMQENGIQNSEVLEWVSLGGTNSIDDKELEYREPGRFFNVDENLTYVSCAPKCCYMIPENSVNKEAAWNYLHTLLLPEWQVKYYEMRHFGLPSNLTARSSVLNKYAASETIAVVNSLLDNTAVYGGEQRVMCRMFTAEMQRYFHGDSSLDDALDMAENKLNIRYSEQYG